MRLLHIADPHLDLVTHSRSDPATGIPSRTLDVGRAWIRSSTIALDEGVDLVVVAGDVFHGPNPSAASENFFRDGLRILSSAGIPVVVIPGNHDRASHPGQRCVLEIFDDRPNVWVSTKPEVLDIDGIRVATLPSVSREQLMALHPEYSRQQATEAMTDALVRTLGMLRAEGADVLTGHWSVQGTILDNGRDMAQIGETEVVIPQVELEGPWRYIAFGHIHKQQIFPIAGGRSMFAYAGSIDRMNFGESHDPAALVVTIDQGHAQVDRRALPAREFVTVDLDENPDVDPMRDPAFEGAIVRIRIPADRRDEAARLQAQALAAGAHVVKIDVDNVREIRSRVATMREDVGPLDALEQWFVAKDVPEEERPTLRDLAKQLFEAIA